MIDSTFMASTVENLSIELAPPAELLANAKELLRSLGLAHGPLQLQEDVSQNIAISDGQEVFIKCYRRRDGLVEGRNTRLAQAHGAPTLTLLGESDWCTLWRWENILPLPLAYLPTVMGRIRRFHQATLNSSLIETIDYSYALAVVLGRLPLVKHSEVTRIVETTHRLCEGLATASAGAPLVFTHCDLQFRNMGMVDNGGIVYDWEICKMAPVELELSKLNENLYTGGSWRPTWTSELYGPGVDPQLLKDATLLRYCQNIAFHWERGEMAIAEKQLVAMTAFEALEV